MTLCPECQRAELDPLHCVYGRGLCCRARAIMATPRRMRRQAADAVLTGLSPLERHQVRIRCEELLQARGETEEQAA